MKKLLATITCICILLSLIACGGKKDNDGSRDDTSSDTDNNSNNSSNGNENNSSTPAKGDIKPEDIVFSTVYSDGVAIVNKRDEENKAYVIDKSGKIIFDFPLSDGFTTSGLKYTKFNGGLFVHDGKCYDTKGNVTLPETLGATSFVGIEKDKYIISEKITSTYDSSKKELGVLNTSFEWVIPMTEGYYDLYHSNSNAFADFFWNDVVNLGGKEKRAIKDEYDDTIYLSDGTVMMPQDVNATRFLEIQNRKYIIAENENGVGVLGTDGQWVLEPTVDLASIYNNGNVYIIGDVAVAEFKDNNRGHTVGYYDLLTKEVSTVSASDIMSSYCESAAVTKIIFGDNNFISEVVTGSISVDDIRDMYLYGSDNNKYILVKVHQNVTRVYGDSNESPGSEYVYAVLDRELNWILSGIVGEAEIKGDYLKVNRDNGFGYYNLQTKEFSAEEPSDFANNDKTENSDSFDFNSITNFHKATDFVNGKAAVALWNGDTSELYITVVNEKGEFQFTPIKTPVKRLPIYGLPFFFDGNYIVLSDDIGCGSGYIDSSMTLYTYSASGEKVGEWRASDNLVTWNCSFKYNDGVIVFWLTNGQYSDYYRQSSVKYYTHDFKPLFN